MLKRDKVYLILCDYSTDDYNGISTYIYKNKKEAFNKFKTIIDKEKEFYKKEYSHIQDFEIDTNIEDNDSVDYWWNINSQSNYYLHTFIDLQEKEVK